MGVFIYKVLFAMYPPTPANLLLQVPFRDCDALFNACMFAMWRPPSIIQGWSCTESATNCCLALLTRVRVACRVILREPPPPCLQTLVELLVSDGGWGLPPPALCSSYLHEELEATTRLRDETFGDDDDSEDDDDDDDSGDYDTDDDDGEESDDYDGRGGKGAKKKASARGQGGGKGGAGRRRKVAARAERVGPAPCGSCPLHAALVQLGSGVVDRDTGLAIVRILATSADVRAVRAHPSCHCVPRRTLGYAYFCAMAGFHGAALVILQLRLHVPLTTPNVHQAHPT